METIMDDGNIHNALDVTGLSYSFKRHQALKNITFSVKQNSIHGFVGPNGAGKTTTLKIAATILKPQKTGTVLAFGHNVENDYIQVRKKIGFMPDYFSTYRHMTVFEYLDFFAAAYGLEILQRDKVIGDLLALTDMDNRKDAPLKSLSRGMQQRVSLARMLVHDPSLLLLDEPASGLDPRARIELMEILRELRKMGKTIFISSHILSELADLCDSVTILDAGTVKYSGEMRDLLKHGQNCTGYVIGFKEKNDRAGEEFRKIPGVTEAIPENEGLAYRISVDESFLSPNEILSAAINSGAETVSFKEDLKHLNQIFLDLTQPGVRN